MRSIDLFCGCGGFSAGARNAGIAVDLAFDNDPILTSSFSRNHPRTKLVLADLSSVNGTDVERELGGHVDGVFGGPPCQAFSDIGYRKADDPRRTLVGHFFRLIAELRPAFFVMENVKGLGYIDARPVLERALELVSGKYDILGPIVLDAAEFGAATRRSRMFVIGIDPTRLDRLTLADIERSKAQPVTVREAISDLANAEFVGDSEGYDLWKLRNRRRSDHYVVSLRSVDGTFTGHRKTAHSPSVAARFENIEQGSVDAVGRHPRLSWTGQCPALRAGTGNDRGSFQSVRPIHPNQPRVITVREGARLQGFPDEFRFHPTAWHSFRMIGNSVSPIMSRAIFSLIAERIETRTRFRTAAE